MITNTQQAELLYKNGLFSNRTAGVTLSERLKVVNSALLPLLQPWNRRFTAKTVKAMRDKTKVGSIVYNNNSIKELLEGNDSVLSESV